MDQVPPGFVPDTSENVKPSGFVPDGFVPDAPEEETSVNPWLLGAGAAAAGAGAYALTKNPGVAKKVGQGILDLRRMSMLSGLAPLKSFLGNIGGSAYASIERESLAPLREMLSSQTAKDALAVFKAGPNYINSGPATGMTRFNLPGRVMGALDTASQNALQRAGLSSSEAAAEMLQSPLPSGVSSRLKGPVADFLVPFRRTPFNQLLEGFNTVQPKNLQTFGQKAALGTSLASGAVTGATAEDPKTIALGTAFSGRRGLPFALAAGAARAYTSGSKRQGMEAVQGMSPVSDYSLGQGVIGPVMTPTDPESLATAIGLRPAAINAADYLKQFLGIQ